MKHILRIANLCKTYRITNSKKQEVLKGINLEISNNETIAILGESGCGKSTLLNILGGLDTDYTGSVVIKGKFIRDFSEKQMDDYRKNTIGFIFQNYNLISHMSIGQNVEIALQMSNIDKKTRKERVIELLKIVGLDKQIDKYPNQLSGGQKQRVAIARCLANNPSIILADEPTGALDNESAEQVLKILKKIAEMGKLVLIVTHSNKVAENCNRIIKLDNGLIVSDEQKTEIAKEKNNRYLRMDFKNISLKELFRISVTNVKDKLSRSMLVSFAISIGIAALILILSLSKGITDYVIDYYNQNALSTIITVTTTGSEISQEAIDEVEKIDGIGSMMESHYEKSIECLVDEIEYTVSNVLPYVSYNMPDLLYGKEAENDDEIIIDLDFASTISDESVISVIGKKISFKNNGEEIIYNIVGIFDNENKYDVYLTIDGVEKIKTGDKINVLYLKAKDITYLENIIQEIEELNLIGKIADDSSQLVLEYIDLGTIVLTAVAAISMVVSSIMIIIVLYISVIERTQEIGILRSIGARRKDVYKIFVFEALILGVVGGLLGIVISITLSVLTNLFTTTSSEITFISYNIFYYLIGFIISVLVSVIAGIAPSLKAAKLDPIEALRYE